MRGHSVSQTIVRTALQALAHDRPVQLEPNRSVRRQADQAGGAGCSRRALIEPKVAAMAAEVARAADIKQLRRHLEEEHRALHSGRLGDAVQLSAQFHGRLPALPARAYWPNMFAACARGQP